MKQLERYVFGSFLSSFVLAFLVLTFVLTVGLMVQIVGYVLDGVPVSLVGEFALVSFPETLQWTMPLALLVSGILVFSRLSADSEIAAMRACGVNLLSVMKWPIGFAAVCTLLAFYVNNEIVPRGHEVRRSLKSKVSVGTGLDMLKPGVVIKDFEKFQLYFREKKGNVLYDLMAVDYSDEKVGRRTVSAAEAEVTGNGRNIEIKIEKAVVDPCIAGPAVADAVSYVIKDALRDSHYSRRTKDFRTRELFTEIARSQDLVRMIDGKIAAGLEDGEKLKTARRRVLREISNLRVEFSKRLVLAFASICFVLVGVPLGIKAQRKESTVGMAIALVIALGYYLVVMWMVNLEDNYSIYPHYLIWIPVAVCFAVASRLVARHR